MQQGHPYDFVSDAQIGKTRWENGQLITEGGSAYRTILVPAARFMKIETARHLIELAKSGASIMIWKTLPQSVPGWHNYKKFDASEWPDEPSGLLGPVKLIPLSSE